MGKIAPSSIAEMVAVAGTAVVAACLSVIVSVRAGQSALQHAACQNTPRHHKRLGGCGCAAYGSGGGGGGDSYAAATSSTPPVELGLDLDQLASGQLASQSALSV